MMRAVPAAWICCNGKEMHIKNYNPAPNQKNRPPSLSFRWTFWCSCRHGQSASLWHSSHCRVLLPFFFYPTHLESVRSYATRDELHCVLCTYLNFLFLLHQNFSTTRTAIVGWSPMSGRRMSGTSRCIPRLLSNCISAWNMGEKRATTWRPRLGLEVPDVRFPDIGDLPA